MAGRRSKYTPDRVARICQAIELGATYELAASYGGITFDTFASWRDRHPAFLEAVKDAEGRAAVKWLAKIEQAASDGTWQAAAWKLERRYPREYGRTVQEQNRNVSHSFDMAQAQRIAELTGIPAEEIIEHAKRLDDTS